MGARDADVLAVPLCEWCFRVCSEPRRLWRRYAYIVPGFTFLAVGELVRRAATAGREKRWIARLSIIRRPSRRLGTK
jgi:N-acetylglucosaminyldiphosphoundecaprenol N-acetyl-beta-D-mannosaminyltransferase